MTTPAERGFRLPAATTAHECTAVGWPSLRRVDQWRGHLGAARDAVAALARILAERERVLVVADEGEGRAAESWVGDGIEVVELPTEEAWLRDTGPVVLLDDGGDRLAVDLGFNGWGGVAAQHGASAIAAALATHLGLPAETAPFVAEGGAFVADGRGRVLVTEPSVVTDDRNPGRSRDQLESDLRAWLGVDEVVWLVGGRHGDHTGSHADDVVAFADEPGTVLLQTTTATGDPDHATAEANRVRLEEAGLAVVEIDVLPHVECFDVIVEVPYLNIHVGSTAIYVPIAGAAADRDIVAQIGEHFPGREAVPVPAAVLAYGGGGVRDVTLPVPAGTAPTTAG